MQKARDATAAPRRGPDVRGAQYESEIYAVGHSTAVRRIMEAAPDSVQPERGF